MKYNLFALVIVLILSSFITQNSFATEQIPVIITQENSFTGRGNKNEVLIKIKLTLAENTTAQLNSIALTKTDATQLSDVDKIKIYVTGNKESFDSRTAKGATLIGEANLTKGLLNIPLSGQLTSGDNFLWITADVATNAVEGNKIGVYFKSLTYDNSQEIKNKNTGNLVEREILLARKLVFAPGDFGSSNYRIPAIITANDGSLVTITDKRKYNSVDLPEDIDLICRRSEDGGKTWLAPTTIARGEGRFKGYGDAVIMKTKSGKLVVLFVGGTGLWNSTAEKPICSYVTTSEDNGKTWSKPTDITSQIFGAECNDAVRATWQAQFFGSGQGLCLRDGRIMAVAAVRETLDNHVLNNYAVYSDDEGKTWHVSGKAITGGDESKVVELNDGTILMSIRTRGNRLWAKSTDRGETWSSNGSWNAIWGNACDADIIRYTSTKEGYKRNRILHTLPNNEKRENVTMWLSYDEGESWPIKKTICPNTSAYSSITILPDGSIGVYLEEDENEPYKMYFLNFSLEWLTNGKDKYESPKGKKKKFFFF